MSITNTVQSVTTLVRGLIKDQQKTDGKNIFEYESDNKFTLSKSFVDADSIRVIVNGTEIDEDDWSFDTDTNRVVIEFQSSGDELTEDDIIIILFSYYQKYSDNEIRGYINSSLSYFVQHKYKKSFEIDEDDNILATDDLQPTIDELYFIAIIASIVIDPQNVEINTPEFKLTANRSESDQDQINKAFLQYKRLVGRVYFEEILDCDNC